MTAAISYMLEIGVLKLRFISTKISTAFAGRLSLSSAELTLAMMRFEMNQGNQTIDLPT
jgi:hypothetical protein